jgi:hypothetical protein
MSEAIGLDFFRVSLNALKDARLIRLIRVLESDSKTASFWYLLRANEKLVKSAAKKANLDLVELRDVAQRLRGIRDKTFVHIDKDGVFDSQQFYSAARLNDNTVAEIIARLWSTMEQLRVPAHGGHDSGLMADSVPASWRTAFRFDGGHCLGRSGMVSAMIPERLGR